MMKSFCVDFNWFNGGFAPQNLFANSNVKELVKWYKELGCNNFWTFAVSYNGCSWYDSQYSPKIQGLKGNFTRECVEEGHKEGLEVFAYHCLAANPIIEQQYPQWSRQNRNNAINLIFCDEYIDLFCKMINESIEKGEYDGLVIDWFRCPSSRLSEWNPTEIDLYNMLMEDKVSKGSEITDENLNLFEKRSIERAWRKVKDTVVATRDIKIWTNQPFEILDDPVWNDNILMKEVDFLLNEGPNFDLLNWIRREAGEHTQVIQNLCGWATHDLTLIDKIDKTKFGFFGFAAADPRTCLPFESVEGLKRKADSDKVAAEMEFAQWTAELVEANNENIDIIKKQFSII